MCVCVCLFVGLLVAIYRKIFDEAQMSLCSNYSSQVQCQQPEAKTTEAEAYMVTHLRFVQLLTFTSGLLKTVVETLQVSAMHKQHS